MKLLRAAEYGVFPGDWKIRDVDSSGILPWRTMFFKVIDHPPPRFSGAMHRLRLLRNLDFSCEVYSKNWGRRAFSMRRRIEMRFIDRTNSIQTPFWTPDNPTNDYARLFSVMEFKF